MELRKSIGKNVLTAAKERIAYTFDHFDKIMISFSGGKDSSVMFHLVMEEAMLRGRKVGVMLIDMEAQYAHTSAHAERMFDAYRDYIDLHWICLPIKLRNAVSNYQPTWTCWDGEQQDLWVREMPKHWGVKNIDNHPYDFFVPRLEFEEFIVMFADWYAAG